MMKDTEPLAMKAKVSAKGWIVIPAALRKKYGIASGDEVRVVDYGGVLALVPAFTDPVSAGRGLLKGKGRLTDALLEERRAERQREEQKVARHEGGNGAQHEDD
jgi:AbrB family looped-hinge helix DNA binding protein